MIPSSEQYAQLAALFTTDAAADVHPAVELLLLAHLPAQGGLWLVPYAGREAEHGVSMLVRMQKDVLEIAAIGKGEVDLSRCTSFDDVLDLVDAPIEHWIVQPPADADPTSLLHCDVDCITLLSGADQAAVVGAYRLLKSLIAALGSAENLPMIRLVIVGAEERAANDAASRIIQTAHHQLGIQIEIGHPLPAMGSANNVISQISISRNSNIVDFISRIRSKVDRDAVTSEPAELEVALMSDSLAHAPISSAPVSVTPAHTQVSDSLIPEHVSDSLTPTLISSAPSSVTPIHAQVSGTHTPTPDSSTLTLDSSTPTSGSSTPTSDSSTPTSDSSTPTSGSSIQAPDSNSPPQTDALRGSSTVSEAPSVPEIPPISDDNIVSETIAKVVGGVTTQVGGGTVAQDSKSAKQCAPLVSHVEGLLGITPRCPSLEHIELAIDNKGCLHLLANASDFRDASIVAGWLVRHKVLIALACGGLQIDSSASPIQHLFTDDAASVAELQGSGVQLHLLTDIEVDGHRGLFSTPLN